ncbi:MAG TPA: ATP-binding cassette domain-containing protein, partial [Pirellulales bacterium]
TLADMTGRLLLDDVSLAIPAGGQTVLFCTDEATPLALAGLLPRFCDPTAGQVLYDGRDVRQAKLESLRHQVLLILPDRLATDGTLLQSIVGDNHRFTPDEIKLAIQLAQADDVVRSLSKGLETIVGSEGVQIGVGQAIRLALARVVLCRPSVVVIAEPTEDIDQATAERIAEALQQTTKNCTLIVLARRLATLRSASRILLFHEGKLVASGTHPELLLQSELYRHLNYVRFNEFRDKLK